MSCAYAFAPGHVTGFFQIYDKGSRGAGLCLSKGVVTKVEVRGAKKRKIEIFLNGKKARAEVTRKIAEELIGKDNFQVRIRTKTQLPISQGFGMSGAGALSTALALNKALNLGLSFNKLVALAHRAELSCKTGLGDVAAQSLGGFDLRLKEGLPPFGKIKNLDWDTDSKLVVCIIGKELKTRAVLTNPNLKKKINFWGGKCLKKFVREPSIDKFFALSSKFAIKTGLATPRVIKAIEQARKHGYAAQAMLGNSIFALGNTTRLATTLKKLGRIYICSIGKRAELLS